MVFWGSGCAVLEPVASELCRLHDARVTGTAAEVPGELTADFLFVDAATTLDHVSHRQHHAGRAKAALQTMRF